MAYKSIEDRKNKQKEYYQANKEKRILKSRKWHTDNKDKAKANKLRSRYNISTEQLEVMYKEQGDCCKICNTHKYNTPRGLFIDHNHDTLEVRGLLCSHCNTAIGMLKDDPKLLDKAKQYLKTNGKFN